MWTKLIVSAMGTGVLLGMDKSRVNGPKSPPSPLAVLGKIEASSRRPKSVGGPALPRTEAIFRGEGILQMAHLTRPTCYCRARRQGGAPSLRRPGQGKPPLQLTPRHLAVDSEVAPTIYAPCPGFALPAVKQFPPFSGIGKPTGKPLITE